MSTGSCKNVIYAVHSISFQIFFEQAFTIVVDSWEFSMLLVCILWDDWPIFMISASNKQLQQQLEYTLLKPDSHSWWISKLLSDTLEEQYAIKFCFKLGKNATETYAFQTAFQPSCMNRASVFEWHKRFKEGRESVRDDERCGRSKEVNTPELIGQRFRVTMLRLWRRSLTHSHKRTSMRPSRSCWDGTTSALQPEEITLKRTRVSCVYYQ